ncbi:hypothetical protein JHK87_031336 [Glycine soja]|nr:hypothetical protein JHK87_031336 [Glycine soja]
MSCIYVIDGGDHSFKIGKKHLQANNSTQDEAEYVVVLAIAAFISRLSGKDGLSESYLRDLLHGSEYVLTYEDKDGD